MKDFEYKAIIRTSRGSSGHEAEEMTAVLNELAEDGWWLFGIYPGPATSGGVQTQTLVFEKASL